MFLQLFIEKSSFAIVTLFHTKLTIIFHGFLIKILHFTFSPINVRINNILFFQTKFRGVPTIRLFFMLPELILYKIFSALGIVNS